MKYYNPTLKETLDDQVLIDTFGSREALIENGWFPLFVESITSCTIKPLWCQELVLGTPTKIANDEAYLVKHEAVNISMPFTELKTFALKFINEKRKYHENGGFLTPEGVSIHTDTKTQQIVAEAVRKIEENIIQEPVNWLSSTGFIELSLFQLKQISAAISLHIQYCFNRQKECWDAINLINESDANAMDNLLNLDLDSKWPIPASSEEPLIEQKTNPDATTETKVSEPI